MRAATLPIVQPSTGPDSSSSITCFLRRWSGNIHWVAAYQLQHGHTATGYATELTCVFMPLDAPCAPRGSLSVQSRDEVQNHSLPQNHHSYQKASRVSKGGAVSWSSVPQRRARDSVVIMGDFSDTDDSGTESRRH